MSTKRAKTLTDAQFTQVLNEAASLSTDPLRERVILLLSFKAGLRAAEIAGLDWSDVTDCMGTVRADALDVPSDIAKKGRARTVPMHPALFQALVDLREALPALELKPNQPVVRSRFTGRFSSNTLRVHMKYTFDKLGLSGVSSHSGRRTFITKAARLANTHGCSLKDVQSIVGHAFIDTTENYIDLSADVSKLVAAL